MVRFAYWFRFQSVPTWNHKADWTVLRTVRPPSSLVMMVMLMMMPLMNAWPLEKEGEEEEEPVGGPSVRPSGGYGYANVTSGSCASAA